MSDEVIVITPEIAPGSGGLADYSRNVVEQWRGRCQVRLLVPQTNQELPLRGGKILLQYSAYGFDRWGYPRWLLHALTNWKKTSGGRLVLMLHETWAFWPWWNKNYPIQQLHRRALGRLLRVADAAFTTTAKQAAQLRRLAPRREVQVMPVGANIRPIGSSGAKKDAGLAVLFGRQAARVRTLRAMQTSLQELSAAERITKVLTIGEGDISDGVEKTLLAGLSLREGFEQHGPQPAEAVSALLAPASFGLSELDEHNVPKSSVFMIYAAHGLNILSPCAGPAEDPPLCWAIRPSELRQGLSEHELALRAEKLRAWQQDVGSWSIIAGRFATALQVAPGAHES